jgi:type IV pilus assembly protein PilV
MAAPRNNPACAGGFSLIEVLVTLVLLSIGLLSLAALQLATLKNNRSALTRSEATTLAYDILDRMRANRVPAIQGGYNLALDAGAPGGSGVAESELREWLIALADRLPGGDGSIAVNGQLATVTVQWAEDWDESLNSQPMQLLFRTEL